MKAGLTFFLSPKAAMGCHPERVTTDGHGSPLQG
jgi:hypothetical protein